MMKYFLTILSIGLSSFVLICCNSAIENSDTFPSPNVIVARIDQTQYSGQCTGSITDIGGFKVVNVSAVDAQGRMLSIFLSKISSPGVYDIGDYILKNGNIVDAQVLVSYNYIISDTVRSRYGAVSGKAGIPQGSMTITDLTDSTFRATFSATLTPCECNADKKLLSLSGGSVSFTGKK
ncbi:MAG: hypothetical protein Q8916_05205 [Bacteroidota bacterium]|nr:hypothetical protein [Bacteroidota bacterium]MDP4229786.1 hypothetical protein [Bacteroidota bacterium]MDP4236675.1 hypothetical protein [Bacteroidota bacterium]